MKSLSLLLLIAVWVAAILPIPACAGPIVVAPGGSDTAEGSMAHPFATLPRAREAARQALKRGESVEVILRAGTYELAEPLELGPEDSGSPQRNAVWRAADGEEVRISAGRIVKVQAKGTPLPSEALKLIREEARGKIQVVDLRAQGISDFGDMSGGFNMKGSTGLEVFVDDEPMHPSRYPNEGFIKIAAVRGPTPFDIRGDKGTREGIIDVEDRRILQWQNEKDARVLGYWFWDWADQHQKIVSIDTEKLSITLNGPPWHFFGYRAGQYFYAYNLLSELDLPGEWYLDRTTDRLYLIPQVASPKRIMASLQPYVLRLEKAAHITLRGIILEGAREHAAVLKDCTGVNLESCVVRNSGKWGVYIDEGKACTVRSCEITATGEGGIALIGGDRRTLTPAGHRVENCRIHSYSRWSRTYQPGIRLEGVGNVATHNLIYNAPHQAIAFGGNDHVIELNEIHHVCQETNDAGAIYAWNDWSARGNHVRYNYLHDITGKDGNGAHAIYLDDNFSSAEITGNILENAAAPLVLGGGRDIKLVNNLFVNCRRPIYIDARGLDWRAFGFDELKQKLEKWPYTTPPWSTRYPELAPILSEKAMAPKGIVVERNIMVGCGHSQFTDNALPFLKIERNLLEAPRDVLATPPAQTGEGSARLQRPDSARWVPHADSRNAMVKEISFAEIPWDKIGLYRNPQSNERPK